MSKARYRQESDTDEKQKNQTKPKNFEEVKIFLKKKNQAKAPQTKNKN